MISSSPSRREQIEARPVTLTDVVGRVPEEHRGFFSDYIWPRLDVLSSDCWTWTLAKHKGYGIVIYGGTKRAHRLVYEWLNGPVPAGLVLDHLCRNRACCNPAHMEAVTSRENVLRGNGYTARNARKTHCSRGHELNRENVTIRRYKDRNQERHCKLCLRISQKAYRAEQLALRKSDRAAVVEALNIIFTRNGRHPVIPDEIGLVEHVRQLVEKETSAEALRQTVREFQSASRERSDTRNHPRRETREAGEGRFRAAVSTLLSLDLDSSDAQ